MRTFGAGDQVTWITSGGAQVTTTPSGEPLLGIFRDAWVGVDVSQQVEILSQHPTLDVRLDDLPEEPRSDGTLIVRQATYRILESQPDGEGMTKLLLSKATA